MSDTARPSDAADAADAAAADPGGHERFVRLFAEHNRRVFSYVLALLPDRTAAEEAFAETSVILWREFGRFTPGTDFVAWACAIAFNQVRAQRRRTRSERLVFSDELIDKLGRERAERVEQTDRRTEALADCRRKLRESDAELLERCYLSDRTFREVAAETGRSANTVYKALRRVRRWLMDCIDARVSSADSEGARR